MIDPQKNISALIVIARLPWPIDDGWKMRTFNLIKGMTKQGIGVDVATFVDPEEASENIRALAEVCRAVYPVPRKKRYAISDLLKGLTGRIPFSVLNYSEKAMHDNIASLTQDKRYEIIMVEDIVMAPYAYQCQADVKFLDFHNVESQLLARYADTERNIFKKMYAQITAAKLRRFEIEASAVFDCCFVCSPEDKSTLAQMPLSTKIEVMPNGIDLECYQDIAHSETGKSIVFVGSMDYHANISGVTHFVTHIFPLIQNRFPALKFFIVGKNPPRKIRSLANEHIVITGRVADVRPYVAGASVIVAPLLVGGGTRLKILEAMALGKAVVSTAMGSEGIPAVAGENIFIGDNPDEFAHHVINLLLDESLRLRIGANAQRFARTNYDWDIITRKISDSYQYARQRNATTAS